METAKGRAWRAHNVYNKKYHEGYAAIDWGHPKPPTIEEEAARERTAEDAALVMEQRDVLAAGAGIPVDMLLPLKEEAEAQRREDQQAAEAEQLAGAAAGALTARR